MEKELVSLESSEAPLSILQREKTIVEADQEKFKNYISHIEQKKLKLGETLKSLGNEFDQSENQVKQLSVEREELQKQVDAQEISPQDVDRMNAERDQLAKTLSVMSNSLDTVTKTIWNEEISLQKKMDSLERSCDKFNTLLYKLDLLGSKKPKYSCLKQELELFVQQSRPEAMVSVPLVPKVKPALMSLIQEYKDAGFKVNDETIVMQDKLDLLSWNVTKREEEIGQVVLSIKTLGERYTVEKEQIGSELSAFGQELEALERQINSLKAQTHALVQDSQHDLKRVTFECEAKTSKLSVMRDDLLKNVMKALTTVFSFEQHISTKLSEWDEHLHGYEKKIQTQL